jgi:diaminopimelate decarboxylase
MDKKFFELPVIKRMHSGMPGKIGLPGQLSPVTHIDGQAVESLIGEFGSPLFVISERTIRETCRKALDAFQSRYPRVQFGWSYKTNYLDAVCRIFHQEGAWAEVVSGFEYDKAIRNGVGGRQILFNGPDKSDTDLLKAINNHSFIHIDHFDELYSIMRLADTTPVKPRVAVRVNMDTGIFPKWDRFGFNYENGEVMEAIRIIIGSGKLELVGLHTHIGTYITSTSAYRIAAEKMAALALSIDRQHHQRILYIDMGGGFASLNNVKGAYHSAADTTPGFDQYAEAITGALIRAGFEQDNLPMLILETGRALVDDAGFLAGTVIATKRLADGRKAIVLDLGVNLLFTSFWYDHILQPAFHMPETTEDTVVYGPLCMNIDMLRDQMKLPLFKKDDQVVISRVGAYNMTQWMQFITLRPNVVLVGMDGRPHLVRKAETLDDLVRKEITPDHLSA